jgi:hypothetical protein
LEGLIAERSASGEKNLYSTQVGVSVTIAFKLIAAASAKPWQVSKIDTSFNSERTNCLSPLTPAKYISSLDRDGICGMSFKVLVIVATCFSKFVHLKCVTI